MVQQKDMEDKHTREQEAKAREYQLLMMKQNKGKKGPALEIADMNVAFDTEGKIMKVSRLDADKLPDVRVAKDIIKSKLHGEFVTQQSQAMLKLQTMREEAGAVNGTPIPRGSQSDFGKICQIWAMLQSGLSINQHKALIWAVFSVSVLVSTSVAV